MHLSIMAQGHEGWRTLSETHYASCRLNTLKYLGRIIKGLPIPLCGLTWAGREAYVQRDRSE